MRSSSTSRPRRIAEALARRAPLAAEPELDVYRLVNGAADGTPGLMVDRYADVAIVHADHARVLETYAAELETALEDVGAAYAKVHPADASRLTPAQLERFAPETPLWGYPVLESEVHERGVRYLIKPAGGLSVGLFIDMREVRVWLRSQTAGQRVLNLFAYTCSLGVVATLGGAARVVNLDVSRPYLGWGKRNYELNDLPAEDRDFIYGDAFDWLARFARRGERFEVVIVDPPSFSSTPFSVLRDYPRLAAAAAHVVAPGGMLLAATNHAGTSDDRFDNWLDHGLHAAGRKAQLLRRWHEPATDFPVAVGQAPYLKVRALSLD